MRPNYIPKILKALKEGGEEGISAHDLKKKTKLGQKQISNAIYRMRREKGIPITFDRSTKVFTLHEKTRKPAKMAARTSKQEQLASASLDLIRQAAMEMPPGYQGDFIDMKVKELYYHECAARLHNLMLWAQAQKERLI